jgi:hypothetical protein
MLSKRGNENLTFHQLMLIIKEFIINMKIRFVYIESNIK